MLILWYDCRMNKMGVCVTQEHHLVNTQDLLLKAHNDSVVWVNLCYFLVIMLRDGYIGIWYQLWSDWIWKSEFLLSVGHIIQWWNGSLVTILIFCYHWFIIRWGVNICESAWFFFIVILLPRIGKVVAAVGWNCEFRLKSICLKSSFERSSIQTLQNLTSYSTSLWLWNILVIYTILRYEFKYLILQCILWHSSTMKLWHLKFMLIFV